MAKKKKKKVEEKYDFKFPKFDEREYLKKEMRDAKVTFVTIGYALVMVIFSFFATKIDFKLGFFIGILGMGLFKKIYEKIGFDTSTFEKKNWAGCGAVYFFTWLGVLILISNPPISDTAPPHISEIWYAKQSDITNDTIAIGDNVTIWVNVTDNSEVKSVDITIWANDKIVHQSKTMKRNEEYKYSFTYPNVPNGTYKFTIKASDTNGNKDSENGGFQVPGKANPEK